MHILFGLVLLGITAALLEQVLSRRTASVLLVAGTCALFACAEPRMDCGNGWPGIGQAEVTR